MSEEQIISLYHFDHGMLHAIEHNDLYWNLTPRLIAEHREKSRADTVTVAKVKRTEDKWRSFMRAVQEGHKPPRKPSKWPKRKGATK